MRNAKGTREKEKGRRALGAAIGFSFFVFPFAFASLAGCSSNTSKPTTRPASVSDRQDAALKDPFGYSPNMDHVEGNGDVGKYDREGMRKDLDHVLNP